MKRVWLILLLLLACAPAPDEQGWFTSAGDWAVPPAYHGNPWAPGGVGVAGAYVYEPLFFFVPATNELLPRLATHYHESADGTLTVRLRKDARWHDGKAFTSLDVKTTFEVGKLKNLEIWTYLDRIETPDHGTVVFHWKQSSPMNRLRALTEPITSAEHLFAKFVAQGDLNEARQVLFAEHPPLPIGTGPFRVTRVTASDMQLDRFPDYYRDLQVKGVRLVRWGRNEVVWSYLFGGEVDALSPACPHDLAEEILKRNEGMRLVTPSDFSEMGLLINTRRKPFDKLEARQALASTLDRDQIRQIAATDSLTIEGTNLGLVQPERWLTEAFLQSLPTTPFKPSRLTLEQDRPVEIMAPSGFTDLALLAEVASAQMSRAGLKAEVRLVPGELYNSWLLDGNFDLAATFGPQLGRWVHPSVALNRFFYRDATLQAGAGLPIVRDGLDTHEVVEALGLETDPVKSRQLVQTLVARNASDLPWIPCFEKRLMIFVLDGKRVQGWPAQDDPIWSAAPLGVEALYCQLLVQGTVR